MMNLKQIRDLVIEISGRADLSDVDSVIDVDDLINEASKALDRQLFAGMSNPRYTKDLASGDMLIPIPTCRAIKAVWLYTADGKTRLSKADSATEMKGYFSEDKASVIHSTPLVYFPINANHIPSDALSASFNQSYAFDDVLYNSPAEPVYPTGYVTVTSDVTLLTGWSGRYIFVNNGSADVILTLPTGTDMSDLSVNFRIVKLGTGRVTLQAQDGYVINDSSVDGTIHCEEPDKAQLSVVCPAAGTWFASGSNIWITS